MCDARWCMMRCQLLSGPSRRGGSSDPCQWFCFLLSPLPFHSFCGLCWRPSIGLNSMRGSIIFFLLVSKVKFYLGGPPPTFSGYILARIAPEVPLYNLLRTLPFQHKYISLTSEEFQKKNIYIYMRTTLITSYHTQSLSNTTCELLQHWQDHICTYNMRISHAWKHSVALKN